MISNLTSRNREDFWIRVYLGSSIDLIASAIKRAYLDFSRTQHGFSKFKSKDSSSILENAVRRIIDEVNIKQFKSQEEFDEWHKKSCDDIITLCRDTTTYQMFYGQAQKWINMSLKYISALGSERVSGIEKNYKYFHIPVDNIIQKALNREGIKPFNISWSRIDSYDDYLWYQKMVRQKYTNQIPLDVEFIMFNTFINI